MKDKKGRHRLKLTWVLFVVYMVLLAYFLFFAESMGRTYSDRDYHYNLILFREIRRCIDCWDTMPKFAMTNLLGNIVAFVPFGIILPILKKRKQTFFYILLFSFEFSLFVEIIQLVSKVGSFDVDDLILNTLGGAIGYLGYWLVSHFGRKKDDEETL